MSQNTKVSVGLDGHEMQALDDHDASYDRYPLVVTKRQQIPMLVWDSASSRDRNLAEKSIHVCDNVSELRTAYRILELTLTCSQKCHHSYVRQYWKRFLQTAN